MTKDDFNWQMERLVKMFSVQNYPDERKNLLYSTVKDQDASWFVKQVNYWILNSRFAPLGPEFGKAVLDRKEEVWRQVKERQKAQETDIYKTLQEQASKSNNPFAKKCIALLNKKLSGEITKEQFLEQCDELDREAEENMKNIKCTCDNGRVFLKNKDGNSVLYACAKCQRGLEFSKKPMEFPSCKGQISYVQLEPMA